MNIEQLFYLLPQEIKSKIIVYYFSYGTPCSKIMRPEIINKCRNNSVSLWFAKVDYISCNKKYMLHNSIGCDYETLCDLRLAIIGNNEINELFKIKQVSIMSFLKRIKKIQLLQLLEEEENNLLYFKM